MDVKKPFANKAVRFGVGIFIAVAAVVLIGGCDRHKIRVRNRHYDHDITVYPSRSRVYVFDTGPRHRVGKPCGCGRHGDGDRDGRSRRSGRTRDRRRRGHGR